MTETYQFRLFWTF